MRLAFASLLAATTLLATGASAAERVAGPRGPSRWGGAELAFEVVVPTGAADADAAALLRAAEVAARSWDAPCSSVRIRVSSRQGGGALVASADGTSSVTFLSRSWCRVGQTSRGCHRPGDLGATTTFYDERPVAAGESAIREADIEVNAVRFDWFGSGQKEAPPVPLASVLAHEMGHALGLADGCDGRAGACAARGPSIMDAVTRDGARAELPTAADLHTLCAMYPGAAARGASTQGDGYLAPVGAALAAAAALAGARAHRAHRASIASSSRPGES